MMEIEVGASTFGSHDRAALLDAFNRHVLPLSAFRYRAFIVQLRRPAQVSVSSGTIRRAPSSTAFWMMPSSNFPLGTPTQQRDGAGRGGRKIFQRHGKRHSLASGIFNRAQKFIADAVEHGDELAAFQAQNMQRVMRLAPVEPATWFTAQCSGGR